MSLFYNVKQFLRNLPRFMRQAWRWRDFDYSYTLECFADNLDRLGDSLIKCNNHIGAIKNGRRAKFAAHKIRTSYEQMNLMLSDVSYKRWSDNNKPYIHKITEGPYKGWGELRHKRNYSQEYSEKMYKTIQKRIDRTEKERKQECWSYLHKHVESWWD